MKLFDHQAFLETLTTRPGVYQMFDAQGHVLYVGKARNLKDRVSSYFRSNLQDIKTAALVQQIDHITITITHSENEALLLESNLIKTLLPRYNILLKDDKSYPYLFLSAQTDFPRLAMHRGAQREKGEYYGPYPSVAAVRDTLDLMQRLFKIRQCSDSFFKSRVRPCLQYQIKRCTAPCVAYIDPVHYQQDVAYARLFLQGKNEAVMQQLMEKMEAAATELKFEEAAQFRDQIRRLRQIQEKQFVNAREGDIDVISIASQEGVMCIEILFVRGGRLIGDKAYFPKVPSGVGEEEVLTGFLPQYYLSAKRGDSYPKQILINIHLQDQQWIQEALVEKLQRKIFITHPTRGKLVQWLQMALMNARHSLSAHLATKQHFYQWLEALQAALKLANLPQRIECFDISHTAGEATVASCVVFGVDGPIRDDYRRFNIAGITPGDDYAAMRQALTRHYARLKEGGAPLPDILLIDGGKGQLAQAVAVLEELQVAGVCLVGVAKGEGRKPGLEKLILMNHDHPLILPTDSPALHLIQRVRDEAHRFAITGHRQQRSKARTQSTLEQIPGVGPKRRRELLRHFGGLQGVMRASAAEISKAPGISLDLAQRIYDALHGG